MQLLASTLYFTASVCAAASVTRHLPDGRIPASELMVDLGYGVYKGFYNSTTDLNIWRGYAIQNPVVMTTPLTPLKHTLRVATYRDLPMDSS
jgi:hypothetical protein